MTATVRKRHIHICMRCKQEFYCMVPDSCQAGINVLPRVVVPGPNGTLHHFEHVCGPLISAAPQSSDGWIPVGERLPEDETPVLAMVKGKIEIAELRWECPGFEDTYKAFRYWDNPTDDGKCWEWYDITHWMPLPSPPEKDSNEE